MPVVAIGAVIAAAAAVGGVLAGGSGSGSEAHASSAIAGPMTLSYSAPWQRGGDSRAIPGLRLRDAAVLSSGDATAIAGVIAQPGATLLPAAVRPRATSVVRLGSTTALRHALAAGSTVYVVPTTSGPVAIGCAGRPVAGCEAIAATLRLTSARALDARPDARYAGRLAVALRGANPSSVLAGASTSAVQAKRARSLQQVHARIARRVRGLQAPAPAVAANRAIAAAAASLAAAYGDLAAAASAHDATGYAAAGQKVRQAGSALSAATGDLTRLGYRVQG